MKRRTKAEIWEARQSGVEPETYWCVDCQTFRPRDEFAKCRKQGRQRRCRMHNAASMRAHRQAKKAREAASGLDRLLRKHAT